MPVSTVPSHAPGPAATAGPAPGEAAPAAAVRRPPRRVGPGASRSPVAVPIDPRVILALARALGIVRGRAPRIGVAGWAAATRSSKAPSSGSTSSKSALSFLSDPKLSIEEKLMRLLAHLNGKWEKEMEAKMKQLAGEDGGTSSASATSTKKKSGGLLGGIGGALSALAGGAVFGGLKIPGLQSVLGKIGGPVLAAAASALGFPAAAPLLLKYGPAILSAASSVAGAATGGTSSASSSGGTSSTGATKAQSDTDRQLIMTEIQRLQEKQKEMFGLVSNIFRSQHDTRMTAINNIR